MRMLAAILCCLIFCVGCKVSKPADPIKQNSPEKKTIIEQIKSRPTPSEIPTKDLPEREKESKTISQLGDRDLKDVKNERRERFVEAWTDTAFYSGIGGLGLGIVAFCVLLFVFKNLKLAAAVGSLCVGLGIGGFCFGYIVAYWKVITICFLISGGLALTGYIWFKITNKLAQYADAAKVLYGKLKEKGIKVEDLKDQLAEAAEHNVTTLKSFVEKIDEPSTTK